MNNRDTIGAERISTGTSSSNIDGRVAQYSDLESASLHENEYWIVEQSTGVWFINRRERGLYYATSGSWYYVPNLDQSLLTTDSPVFAEMYIGGKNVAGSFKISNVGGIATEFVYNVSTAQYELSRRIIPE